MIHNKTSRRQFLNLAGLTAGGLALGSPLGGWQSSTRELIVYVGTYTTGRGEGIYVCRLDLLSGELRQVDVARGVANPSFLTVDPKTRFLYATQGKFPRNFAIEPTGRWLLAANQNSDSVVTFAIDPSSGKLSPTGHSVEIPSPVCVAFLSDKL